jgi:hypothetical protein
VLFPSFGQEIAQDLAPIKQLMGALRQTDKKKLTSIESQILLRELYDTNFKIANHDNPHRPLSLVEMQVKETVSPYSREYRTYSRFAALKVGELFNISIDEFLRLPRERVEMMFQIAEERSKVEDKNNADINRKLAAAAQAAGPGGMSER